MKAYRNATTVLSALTALVGCALIVKGVVEGKPLGLVLGALFLALGVGRLYLLRRT